MDSVLRKLALACTLSACAAPAAAPRTPSAPAPVAASRATPIAVPEWTGEEGNFLVNPGGIWGAGDLVITAGNRGVMRSEDRGKTWEYVGIDLNAGPNGVAVWGVAEDDVYIAARDLYRSRDRGKTWKRTALGTSERPIEQVWGTSGEDIWIAGSGGLLSHSKDHGLSFQSVKHGLSPNAIVQSVAGRGDEVWAAAAEYADRPDDEMNPATSVLLRSKNHGKTWTREHAPPPEAEPLRHVCFTDSGAMYASLGHRVWVTRDDAKTWTSSVTQDLIGAPAEVLSLTCRGHTIVAAGKYRQSRISRDDGATWTENEFESLITSSPTLESAWIHPSGELFIGASTDYTATTMFRFGY